MTMHSPLSRSRRIAIGATAGLALALGAPLAASAHVHVNPGTASAGGTETLAFSFSHGCDGSPTTTVAIDIPEGVGNVTPAVQGGWSITRELGTPVEDGLKATVSMDVLFTEDAAGTTLAFPVTQTCAEGETAWTQIAEDGEDPHDLDAPAPLVEVGAVADDTGHDAAASTEHAGDEDATAAAETPDAASVSSDPVARWLAAGGLAAGLAALAIVLVRGRRKA